MRKMIVYIVLCAFMIQAVVPLSVCAQAVMAMPKPGSMIGLSPVFHPPLLRGMVVDPEKPFNFNFIIAQGDASLPNADKKALYQNLIKYFLAALAVPDQDQWVNLSPYEGDRIIEENFGMTAMGRDLLAQDYILKQVTASLVYPDDALGKQFWNEIYSRAQALLGTTDIPLDMFNKAWITPDEAVVLEKNNTALVLKTHLKVMLEQDYTAMKQGRGEAVTLKHPQKDLNEAAKLSAEVVRKVILPVIEREVNEGKNFANLRQIVSGMVLAAWFKKSLKESVLGRVYADQRKLKGVDQDPANNQALYHQYIEAFRQGAFKLIKDDIDLNSREVIPRKYFSGGFEPLGKRLQTTNNASPAQISDAAERTESVRGILTTVQDEDAGIKLFDIRTAQHLQTGMKINGGRMTWDGVETVLVDINRDRNLQKVFLGVISQLEQQYGTKPIAWTGSQKGDLLQRIFLAIRNAVNFDVNVQQHTSGNTILLGDTIQTGGVCRHMGLIVALVIEKFIRMQILKGKIYYVSGINHGWAVYETSDGYAIVLDVAQNKMGFMKGMTYWNGSSPSSYAEAFAMTKKLKVFHDANALAIAKQAARDQYGEYSIVASINVNGTNGRELSNLVTEDSLRHWLERGEVVVMFSPIHQTYQLVLAKAVKEFNDALEKRRAVLAGREPLLRQQVSVLPRAMRESLLQAIDGRTSYPVVGMLTDHLPGEILKDEMKKGAVAVIEAVSGAPGAVDFILQGRSVSVVFTRSKMSISGDYVLIQLGSSWIRVEQNPLTLQMQMAVYQGQFWKTMAVAFKEGQEVPIGKDFIQQYGGIYDEMISGQHLKLMVSQAQSGSGRITINVQDLQSTNGTKVQAYDFDAAQTMKDRAAPDTKGGIDLNAASLNMQIDRQGISVAMPQILQNLPMPRIDGLIPEIQSIEPVISLLIEGVGK